MLSAPMKSAKRISSLFSLSSNKDSDSQPPHSPVLTKPPPDQYSRERRQSQTSSRLPPRHVSAPFDSSNRRSSMLPPPTDNFDFDLPPPPPLSSVNQDLAESAPSSPDGRPQSRGRRLSLRPSSSGGLFVPGSGPDSRPSTPSKRRSWIPGRGRASSVDTRSMPNSPPPLPAAWIAGLDQKVEYNLKPLARGEQVCPTKLNRTLYYWPSR